MCILFYSIYYYYFLVIKDCHTLGTYLPPGIQAFNYLWGWELNYYLLLATSISLFSVLVSVNLSKVLLPMYYMGCLCIWDTICIKQQIISTISLNSLVNLVPSAASSGFIDVVFKGILGKERERWTLGPMGSRYKHVLYSNKLEIWYFDLTNPLW